MPMDNETAARINAMFARLPRGPWRKVKVMTTEAKKVIDQYLTDPDPAKAYDLVCKVRDMLGDDDECFHGALDPDRTCIGCGATEHERTIAAVNAASNEQQTPIVESSRPDAIEDAIEVLAVRTLDTVKRLIKFPADNVRKHRTTENQLAALIAAGRPFSAVMQTFAGFVTEHTMGVVAEGGPRGGDVQARVKLQDSRASLIERNGNGDTTEN